MSAASRRPPRAGALPVLLAAALLAGCGGANDETLVDELRVMAVVVEPPEVAPGATATITAWVADPGDVAPDALLWTCTNLGDGCLEAAEAAQGTTVSAPTDGTVVTERIAPPALAGVVADGTTVLPVLLWALACAPGVCPAIDLATAAPAAGTDDADALATFLADPFEGAEALPLLGTSLALAQVQVSTRATPLVNPVLTGPDVELVVAPGASIDLAFTVSAPGVVTAYGYTTNGGFDATEYAVVDGAVTLTWFGSDTAGDAELWVIVNGEDGGSAVWHGLGRVE
ncbi:MAG: hypothetical protein Q8P41_11600 [Pseudomonadota bacterium]|nr:hypothetical protein [Pseudomonadota bacterium]